MFVINGLGVGGAETQLLALMAALRERGHTISLVTINDDDRLADALPAGITRYALGAGGWRAAAHVVPQFLRILRRERPEVVHAHLFQANVLSRLAKLAGVNCLVVNTTHCNYGLEHRRYNPYRVYRWTRRLVDNHTAVSGPALEALREWGSIGPERSALLFNAIDVSRYRLARPGEGWNSEASSRPFKWIAVGRLNRVKNYELMLEAAHHLHRSGHGFVLDIAGEGPELDKLRDLANGYGLEERVRFLGLVRNLPERLAGYDGYVISSDNEALPMALLEAMAAGLPVVGTRVGEIPSLLAKSEGGCSVPPGDADELARAMREIMQLGTDALQEVGGRGRAYVESSFGMERIVSIWERVYTSGNIHFEGAGT